VARFRSPLLETARKVTKPPAGQRGGKVKSALPEPLAPRPKRNRCRQHSRARQIPFRRNGKVSSCAGDRYSQPIGHAINRVTARYWSSSPRTKTRIPVRAPGSSSGDQQTSNRRLYGEWNDGTYAQLRGTAFAARAGLQFALDATRDWDVKNE